ALNPGFARGEVELAPDGDAELPREWTAGFRVAACERCGGLLKPDVVFFGESVPATTVARAYALVDDSDALLVIGSSLAVFSGYRFVRRAHDRELPIAIVNLGETRGDPYATLRVDARAGEIVPALASALGQSG
ncbi:MAG TPA: Sir2 family NAD-dependent protein deacetylase, partial [Nannocystaceae bacterium]|nr:Sir2 family NAD-dependent protein deacetylase [Nannocystaceae bacterium]